MMIAATYAPPNLGALKSAPTRYHKCGPGGSETFILRAESVETITSPGVVSPYVFKDLNLEYETNAASRTDFNVSVERVGPSQFANKQVAFEIGNTSILAPPINGFAQGLTAGITTITARAADGEVSSRNVTVSFKSSATGGRLINSVAGSLFRHCEEQIESRTAGKDRSSMDIWSLRNNSTAQYQWNPNCWGADIANITCLSPWNSATGNGGGGVLITPRHVMYCHHFGYHPHSGAKVRYVRPDNVTEEFTVVQVTPHPYTAGWVSAIHDIVVCKLDRDVPSSIKFAKVLPPNPHPKLPTIKRNNTDYLLITADPSQISTGSASGLNVRTLSCHTNQHKRLGVSFLDRLPNQPFQDVRPGQPIPWENGSSSARHETGETSSNPLGDSVWIGDSGAPAFLLINGELVVTNVWTGIGLGFAFYADADIVNGLIDGGYQLTQADLSGFPSY